MIIKGKSRAGSLSLATHLLNEKDNEWVKVGEIRGALGENDVYAAFQDMEDIASGTQCKKAFYHAKISPDPKEEMTPERWARSIEALEENLGLSPNHPRVVVFHEKYGREHVHVVWGRIDPETMRAWHDGLNYEKHEATSRQLEHEFNHERVRGAFNRAQDELRPERPPTEWEMQQGDRLKFDARDVRAEVRALQRQADNGQAFAAALDEAGYRLALGDRRGLVILDPAGGVHSLSRTLEGSPAEKRALLDSVPRDELQPVKLLQLAEREARAAPQEKEFEQAATRALGERGKVFSDAEADKRMTRAAIGQIAQQSADPLEFAIALGDEGLTLSRAKSGRFVAVDTRGDIHFVPQSKALDEAFREGGAVTVPTVGEVRAELRAERAEKSAKVAEARQDRRDALFAEQRQAAAYNPTRWDIQDAWKEYRSSGSGTLAAALDERGFVLAAVSEQEAADSHQAQATAQQKGETRLPRAVRSGEVLAVDRFGNAHALTPRLIPEKEVTLKAELARMSPELPSVSEARADMAQAKEQRQEQRAEEQRTKWAAQAGRHEDVQQLREAYRSADNTAGIVQAMQEWGFVVACVTDADATRSQSNAALARAHGRYSPTYAENDLVAISQKGRAYSLDAVTLDDRDAGQRLSNRSGAEAARAGGQPDPTFASRQRLALPSLDQAQTDRAAQAAERGQEWTRRLGKDRFDTRGAPTLGVVQAGADLGGALLSGIDRFLFGGSQPPRENALNRGRASHGEAPKKLLTQVREEAKREDSGGALSRDSGTAPYRKHYEAYLDPETVAAMRRAREADERARQEQDRQQQGRERDR